MVDADVPYGYPRHLTLSMQFGGADTSQNMIDLRDRVRSGETIELSLFGFATTHYRVASADVPIDSSAATVVLEWAG